MIITNDNRQMGQFTRLVRVRDRYNGREFEAIVVDMHALDTYRQRVWTSVIVNGDEVLIGDRVSVTAEEIIESYELKDWIENFYEKRGYTLEQMSRLIFTVLFGSEEGEKKAIWVANLIWEKRRLHAEKLAIEEGKANG